MKTDIEIINWRIRELNHSLILNLRKMDSYSDANIDEKINCRIIQAEITALELYKSGVDLDRSLKYCVENEHYSGAEGLQRALQWLHKIKPL